MDRDTMQTGRCTKLFPAALFGALLSCANPGLAQETEKRSETVDTGGAPELFDDDVERTKSGWPRLQLAVGLTRLDADGVFAARFPNRPPITIIDFDRVGLDESDSSHWLTLTWRSSKSRWGVWFGNWRYDVNGSRYWEDEITLPRRSTIPVGALAQSRFDANWYILEGTYSLFRNDKVDAGIGFGIHTVDIETRLTAQVDVGDGNFEVVSSDVSSLAPLPNVLAYLYWDFAPRWNMVGRLGWFGMNYDKYSGRMTNAHWMVSYALTDRWSLGGAYQFVSLDVDIEEERYRQLYDVDFSGPTAFARFRF